MATANQINESRAPARIPPRQHYVLGGIDWPTYRSIASALGERRVRLAYDGENLEFMTVSRLHDKLSRLLGRFVVVLTEELGLPLDSAGSTTLDREGVKRALEPDECFYILNEPFIRGKDKIDLAVNPPPDLGIEIDITRSSLDRMGIYAAMRVPEVWRYDGNVIEVNQLGPDGHYCLAGQSRCFPHLSMSALADFLARRAEMDENSLVRAFRDWIREQIANGWKAG